MDQIQKALNTLELAHMMGQIDNDTIEKARNKSGLYSDTVYNRKKGRANQPYNKRSDMEGHFKGETSTGKKFDVRHEAEHENHKEFTSEEHKEVAEKHRKMVNSVHSEEQKDYHRKQAEEHTEEAKRKEVKLDDKDLKITTYKMPYKGNENADWVKVTYTKGDKTLMSGQALDAHGGSKEKAIEAAKMAIANDIEKQGKKNEGVNEGLKNKIKEVFPKGFDVQKNINHGGVEIRGSRDDNYWISISQKKDGDYHIMMGVKGKDVGNAGTSMNTFYNKTLSKDELSTFNPEKIIKDDKEAGEKIRKEFEEKYGKKEDKREDNEFKDLLIPKMYTANPKVKQSYHKGDGLDMFRDMAAKSKDVEDFKKMVREVNDVPNEVAEKFRKKYDPNNNLSIGQVSQKLINEVKGSDRSKDAEIKKEREKQLQEVKEGKRKKEDIDLPF